MPSVPSMKWLREKGQLGLGCDLKNFFGSLDMNASRLSRSDWRPQDYCLIGVWLSRHLEDGCLRETTVHRSALISVLLSNIYLHYVLDLWFERVVNPDGSEVYLIRYLDDFVVCFNFEQMRSLSRGVGERLQKFSLGLSQQRQLSNLVALPFGRPRRR